MRQKNMKSNQGKVKKTIIILASPEAPFLYIFSGGLAVWLFSILEVISFAKKAY